MLLYDYYYRHFGVRRVMQLVSPVLHNIDTLDLPRDSVLHYVGEDDVSYGIAGDDYILRHTTRTILVEYELQLKSTLGNPRGTFQSASKMIRDYQRKYRRFRQIKDIQNVWRDGRNLLIVDYAMLSHLYRYVKSLYSSYYRWYNIQATMWKTIGELVDQSDRHHYIQCTLPTVLPSVSLLNRGETNMTRTVLQALNDPASLFILEIWKWLGKHRDTSMLSHLSDAQLAKVNLIWKESGRWMVINLGLLNSWRKPITDVEEPLNDEDEETSSAVTGTVSAMQLQRRFLRLLMFLFEQRTLMGAGKPQDASTTDNLTQKSDETGDGKNITTAVKEAPPKVINPTIRPLMEGHDIPDIDDPEFDRIIDEAVKADLDALEHIEAPLEFDEVLDGVPVAPVPVVEYEPKNYSFEESIMAKTDQLADAGLLSGAEYRRMTTLSMAYKKLPDPYGKHESLEAQAHIDPKSILIPNKAQIPDIETVFDKSMLKSSLFHFDSHYINEIMPKDISNVVLSVHNAGVAVTGYNVETVEDALNHYDIHTLRLTPVHGNPSTIRFRLPKVQPDGTYVANGVRYRMAKQRGD